MEEERILRALRRKDEAALESVIDQYSAYVHTIVCNILGETDTQDVESEVFFTLWNKAAIIRKGKLKAFLAGVARNKAKEALRAHNRETPLDDDILLIASDNVHKTLEAREQSAILRRALMQMQEPDREIFLRHYYAYQPVAQIAQEMGFQVSTIKTRLHRGRARLKLELTKGGYFDEDQNL